MNQRLIAAIVIAAGLLVAGLTYAQKVHDDGIINSIITEQGGSCYLADGTCLHDDRDYTTYIVGWVISAAMVMLGLYLLLFDRTQETLARQQREVSEALRDAKVQEREKDEFKAFLGGFAEEERKVLAAVREQDGIKQSTLRYRTGITKSSLSLLLKSLEERAIVSRKPAGKTNQVFLRKRF